MKPRARLLLDLALFFAIAVASQPAWTGLALHQWLAALIGIPVLYHVVINWDWVMHTGARLIGRLKTVSRVNFVVDVVLFLTTITVMLSGVMLLPGVISLESGAVVRQVWFAAHKISSNVLLVSMLVHLMLHVRWMAETIERSWLSGTPARPRVASDRLPRTEGRA